MIWLLFLFCFIDPSNLVVSYPDDNTPYTLGKFWNKVLENLECASRNIFEWFFHNAMEANPDKCHFLLSLDMNTKISVSSFDIEIHIHKKSWIFMIIFLIYVKKPVQTLHQKWSFPLRISLINVAKSAGNSGFGHIYRRSS